MPAASCASQGALIPRCPAGYFEKEDAAGQAWDLAALKYFGETSDIISKLNFPASLDLFRQQQAQQAAVAQRAAAAAAAAAAVAAAGAPGSSEQASEPQYRGVVKVGCRLQCDLTGGACWLTQRDGSWVVGLAMADFGFQRRRSWPPATHACLPLGGRRVLTPVLPAAAG